MKVMVAYFSGTKNTATTCAGTSWHERLFKKEREFVFRDGQLSLMSALKKVSKRTTPGCGN
jgi:hypothetical protein